MPPKGSAVLKKEASLVKEGQDGMLFRIEALEATLKRTGVANVDSDSEEEVDNYCKSLSGGFHGACVAWRQVYELRNFLFNMSEEPPHIDQDKEMVYLSLSYEFENFSFGLNLYSKHDNSDSNDPPLATEFSFEVPPGIAEAHFMWIPYGSKRIDLQLVAYMAKGVTVILLILLLTPPFAFASEMCGNMSGGFYGACVL
ncbi:hypothetical protein SUGI_0914920 [Cryptomeria japonica]|nr:hypothetical protein SUGI_0914920 [Cryptomeria japonica]